MYKLPIFFNSEAQAAGDFEKLWTTNSDNRVSDHSIPTEFGGAGGGFSPEDFFLQSVINCFIGTFKVVSKGSRLSFSNLTLNGRLTVDKGTDGRVFMKTIDLHIKIFDADRPDRVETIVNKVFRDGFIINSVKSEIKYELEILQSTNNIHV